MEVKLYLKSVQDGSIITDVLRKIIKPDESKLLQEEILGNIKEYTEESQNILIEEISNATEQKLTNKTVDNIQEKLIDVAQQTGIQNNINYRPQNKVNLARNLKYIASSTKNLDKDDKFILPFREKPIEIVKFDSIISVSEITRELATTTIETPLKLMLKAKIVDFIGKIVSSLVRNFCFRNHRFLLSGSLS